MLVLGRKCQKIEIEEIYGGKSVLVRISALIQNTPSCFRALQAWSLGQAPFSLAWPLEHPHSSPIETLPRDEERKSKPSPAPSPHTPNNNKL